MSRWPILAFALGLTGCSGEPPPPTEAPASDAPAPSAALAPDRVDTTTFWRLIAEARSAAGLDDDAFLKALTARLDDLPANAVADFEHELQRAIAGADRWDLWGAAYAILGGCSDDGFEYFRAWLVSQGEDVYVAAVAEPDSLAEQLPLTGEPELELLLSVASDVYERKAGGFIPSRTNEAVAPTGAGEEWDFDDEDEMRRRLPRLSARLAEG